MYLDRYLTGEVDAAGDDWSSD
jgi:hypothetical protein